VTAEASAREIRAAGAGPDRERLRRAYLGLLKLALCDLAGPSTTSVEGLPHGELVSHELSGERLRLRAEGRDWPLHGLSMSGLSRLDELQACVETVVNERLEGDLVEAGCWRGGGSILMRAVLDTLGEDRRTVWVADSFQGFPAADAHGDPAATYSSTVEPYLAAFDFLAAPLEEVKASFARLGCEAGVRFVPGFFEDTLPDLTARPWALIRIDADTYDATLVALRCLYPGLVRGGHLLIDDYGALDECRAAVERFRDEHGISEPLERIDWTAVRWRRESEAAIEPMILGPERTPRRARADRAQDRRSVATRREIELAVELGSARERISILEAELERAEQLEQELAEVTTSTSWRMTRPLRKLRRYIRERQR
jgi:O-methyltransferase